MNNQKPPILLLSVATLLLFTSLGFVASAFRDQNADRHNAQLFALEEPEDCHKAVPTYTLNCDNEVTPLTNILVLDSVSRDENGDKTIHRTVVRVMKDAQPTNQPLDQNSVKSLKANASLNMVIENYAFRRHSETGVNGICEVSYEFTIESFSTTLECRIPNPSPHAETVQTAAYTDTTPLSRWNWVSRFRLARRSV